MSVIDEIGIERERQVEQEKWTPEHDDEEHQNGELALAAAAYCVSVSPVIDYTLSRNLWPFEVSGFKPTDARRSLVKAAALIIAEIERMDRATGEGK